MNHQTGEKTASSHKVFFFFSGAWSLDLSQFSIYAVDSMWEDSDGEKKGPIYQTTTAQLIMWCTTHLQSCIRPGGYSNYFLTECAARGTKPLPMSKDFSHSKNGWLDSFFEIFANRDPFLRGFLPQKRLILQVFRNFFVKWPMGPSSKDFLTRLGPMSKDFWWKGNPFGRHIPVCLHMWVLPPPGASGIIHKT